MIRSLRISVFVALAAIAAQACGGGSFTFANQNPTGDSGVEASAGTGGSAGGGTGGSAGSVATGGAAGTAGEAGIGGMAGTGGIAGSSGTGGEAGIAGTGGEPDAGSDADVSDAADEPDAAPDVADEPDAAADATAEEATVDAATDAPADAAIDAPHDAVAEEAAPPLCQAGQTEDCYDGPSGTEGIGLCTGGTRSCTNGAWGPCQGQVLPKQEKCDWQDDDCDGIADDVIPAQPVALTTAAGGRSATIAYASGALGIAWVRPDSGKDQAWFGTANVSNGARLVADVELSNANSAESHEAAIAAAGAAWKIATLDTLPVAAHAAMTDADKNGTVTKSASTVPDGGDPANVGMAADGNGNALAVYDANGLLSRDIYYALWNGGSLVSHGVVAGGLSGQDSRHPAVIWTGSQYLAFWQRDSGPKIVAKAMSTTGSTTGNVLPTNGNDGFEPSPVWTPSGPAFSFRMTDYSTIRLTRMDQNVQNPQTLNVVSAAGASYQDANLGWNGTDFAVAWVEISGGSRHVKAVRVMADGSAVSVTIPISDAGAPGTVRIVPTGASWSIVWDADGNGGRQLFWSSICR